MEDGISMATKRQITLRFRDEYMKASKKDKGRILDEMCSVFVCVQLVVAGLVTMIFRV